MKISGIGRSHPRKRNKAVMIVYILLFFALPISTALCASGGEGGTKTWEWEDTYRVMNFTVLAVALVFILRKPLSQALSSRIKSIKEQLNDLEQQKAEAEKQLAEYKLDTPPVWDGMAIADGKLYIAGMDGSVVCMQP